VLIFGPGRFSLDALWNMRERNGRN
jgi:hypothetical protein